MCYIKNDLNKNSIAGSASRFISPKSRNSMVFNIEIPVKSNQKTFLANNSGIIYETNYYFTNIVFFHKILRASALIITNSEMTALERVA